MNSDLEPPEGTNIPRVFSISILVTVISVGFSSLAIILAALFAGLWLDKLNTSEPAFTIGFLLGSIPISILVMIIIVKALLKRFNTLSDSKT